MDCGAACCLCLQRIRNARIPQPQRLLPPGATTPTYLIDPSRAPFSRTVDDPPRKRQCGVTTAGGASVLNGALEIAAPGKPPLPRGKKTSPGLTVGIAAGYSGTVATLTTRAINLDPFYRGTYRIAMKAPAGVVVVGDPLTGIAALDERWFSVTASASNPLPQQALFSLYYTLHYPEAGIDFEDILIDTVRLNIVPAHWMPPIDPPIPPIPPVTEITAPSASGDLAIVAANGTTVREGDEEEPGLIVPFSPVPAGGGPSASPPALPTLKINGQVSTGTSQDPGKFKVVASGGVLGLVDSSPFSASSPETTRALQLTGPLPTGVSVTTFELKWVSATREEHSALDTVKVTLVPVEINSLDKYVDLKIPESTIEALGGVQMFSLRLSKTSGETYEVALKDAKIYDRTGVPSDEGVFFPTAEASATTLDPRAHDQGTAPIAVAKENGMYRLVTCFDSIGAINVEFKKDTTVIASVEHTLKAHADMAELIDRLEGIFRESFTYRGGGGDNPAAIALMAQIPMSSRGVTGPRALGFWSTITNRNLVAKCCSAVFDVVKDAVRDGVVVIAEGVQIAVVGAQGFCQGFWAGVKSDAQSVADFVKMLAHPIDTGKSLYEGFRGLCSMSMAQIKGIPKKMLDEYLTNAQQSIAWADPTGADLIAYTAGYTAGYLAEQVLVSIIKAVFVAPAAIATLVTTGAKVAKLMSSFKAGTKVLGAVQAGREVIAKVQAAKNLAVKSCTQFITDKTGLDKVEAVVKRTLQAGCPVLAP